jgi:hypothetical protein
MKMLRRLLSWIEDMVYLVEWYLTKPRNRRGKR